MLLTFVLPGCMDLVDVDWYGGACYIDHTLTNRTRADRVTAGGTMDTERSAVSDATHVEDPWIASLAIGGGRLRLEARWTSHFRASNCYSFLLAPDESPQQVDLSGREQRYLCEEQASLDTITLAFEGVVDETVTRYDLYDASGLGVGVSGALVGTFRSGDGSEVYRIALTRFDWTDSTCYPRYEPSDE